MVGSIPKFNLLLTSSPNSVLISFYRVYKSEFTNIAKPLAILVKEGRTGLIRHKTTSGLEFGTRQGETFLSVSAGRGDTLWPHQKVHSGMCDACHVNQLCSACPCHGDC
jgi:hypothetical protein